MTLPTAEVWNLVHAERRHLVHDLAPLRGADWNTASLCKNWTVHDVLAHLVDTAHMSRLAFVASMVRARGDFHRANEAGVHHRRRQDPLQTLADLHEASSLTRTPPAHRATRLVEAIVHGEDIRRPLGLPGEYPRAAVQAALDHQLRTPLSVDGGRERAAGLRLVDVDDGTSWGEGPEVQGASIDLLLAVSGRSLAPQLLSGLGAADLTSR